jgi:hypothetical protein
VRATSNCATRPGAPGPDAGSADGVSWGTIGTVKGIARTPRDAAKIQRVPGGRRVGKAQLQRRLNEVEKLLAKGAARSEIIERTQLRPRTADDYIRRVREAWHADAQQNRQSVREQARDRLMLLRDRLLQAGAWGPLVSLEKLILDLEGLRGECAPAASNDEGAGLLSTPPLTVPSLRDRGPLLISACTRVILGSKDGRAIEQTRRALMHSLSMLETHS